MPASRHITPPAHARHPRLSRRHFLAAGTLGAAGLGLATLLPFQAFGAKRADTVRLGLIGVGNRGTGLANLLHDLPGIELAALCDLQAHKVEAALPYAAKGARSYADHRELLEDKRLDGVIIAVPLHVHYQVARDAIDAGKHLYLEKTMSYDIPQAVNLVRLAEAHPKLVFQTGHQYRYYGLYHTVAEMIRQGELGSVLHYECQYHRNSDWRLPVTDPALERTVNWRLYKASSGGLLAELSAHQIDVINWFTGSHPDKVTAMGGINYWKDGRETFDHVRAIYAYPSGIKADISSTLSNAYKGYAMRILGTKGTVEIQQSQAFFFPEGGTRQHATVDGVAGATVPTAGQGEGFPIPFASPDGRDRDPTAYALLDFARCIRDSQAAFSSARTGCDAAIAVHIGNQAAESEQPQRWHL